MNPKWLSVPTSHLMRWVLHHPRGAVLAAYEFSQGMPLIWTGEGAVVLALDLHHTRWSLLKQCWAAAWESACFEKFPGEAAAAGLGTPLRDPCCRVVYLGDLLRQRSDDPWLPLPEGQLAEDDGLWLIGRSLAALRNQSEHRFHQNFPTVGRTLNHLSGLLFPCL